MRQEIIENKKLNLEEQKQGKLFLKSKPHVAWLALTGRCNLSCEHCPRIKEVSADLDISDKLYERFCNEILPTLETLHLGGNNFGEQLLSDKITDFLKKAYHEGVKVELVTNGVLLKGAILDNIIENEVSVDISAEGADRNYSRIRHIDYKFFKNNVETLVAERNKKKKNLTISIAYTLFKTNLEDLFKLLDLGVDRIMIGYLNPKNAEWAELAFSREEIEKIQSDFIPLLTKEASCKNIKIIHRKVSSELSADCDNAWSTVSVTEAGDVFPCCSAGHSLMLEKIKNKPFRDVWNGRGYIAFRKSFVSGKLKYRCRTCYGIASYRGDSPTDRFLKSIKFFLIKFKLFKIMNFFIYLRKKIEAFKNV